MKQILVVGSGTGGTLTANLLSSSLRGRIRDGDVSVTLVGEGAKHPFQPANLDIAFKGASPESFVREERDLLSDGVTFIEDPAATIDLKGKRILTEGGRKLSYDYLVIATGAVADPDRISGLREDSFNFHTGPRDAGRLWSALQSFKGGTIVIAIAGTPHKCPPSPNEAAFMLDELFTKRGIRDRVTIKFLTPYPRPYPAEKISNVVAPLLEEKGVEVVPFFNVDSVDPKSHTISSLEGESYEYDMLITVPPHRGADVILRSSIGDQDGWIPTERGTMNVKGYSDVYALGDATDIPVSKSGVVAHLQSVVVAKNIVSDLEGSTERLEYNGRINCPMEVGGRRAIFVSATYTSPASDQKPSFVKYVMKKSFVLLYWRALGGSLEWIFDIFFGQTRKPVAKAEEKAMVAPLPQVTQGR
ncbi:MAG: NAD(P)/FAD-dependent oxidoreductase [Thaumarchaeota archaeon]|nr:NAD(P)/FAD-dependent oxidoreductase [Nitrososphaerota archaeon]